MNNKKRKRKKFNDYCLIFNLKRNKKKKLIKRLNTLIYPLSTKLIHKKYKDTNIYDKYNIANDESSLKISNKL